MAALTEISIDVKKIDKSKLIKGQYLNLVVSTRDECNQYDQNASVFYSQTKEERDAKENKSYIGNGKVVWTDGNIKAAKELSAAVTETLDSNLEF
mgnify:CR=1 FL=1|jgi:phosphoenolpyruvate-protein kinase (PTS system EI component)|tara:strand:- start:2334 stop:2618 length:285 start_codon:yes stop_codon:yes gene_type:complete